jgi:hypothetical protein
MRIRAIAILLLGSGLVGMKCSKSMQSISTLRLEDLPHLQTLRDVDFGMTLKELRSIRKATTKEPYLGVIEVLEGDTIIYRFHSVATNSEAELSGGAIEPLESDQLYQLEVHLLRERGERLWSRESKDANVPGSQRICFQIPYLAKPSFGIERSRDPLVVTVLDPERTIKDALRGARGVPSAVRIILAKDPDRMLSLRIPEPCRQLPSF